METDRWEWLMGQGDQCGRGGLTLSKGKTKWGPTWGGTTYLSLTHIFWLSYFDFPLQTGTPESRPTISPLSVNKNPKAINALNASYHHHHPPPSPPLISRLNCQPLSLSLSHCPSSLGQPYLTRHVGPFLLLISLTQSPPFLPSSPYYLFLTFRGLKPPSKQTKRKRRKSKWG